VCWYLGENGALSLWEAGKEGSEIVGTGVTKVAERERNREHSSVLYFVIGKVQRERRFKGEMQSLIPLSHAYGNNIVVIRSTVVFRIILFFLLEHPGTKFTQEPPGKVFGNLGYDVSFHWKFAFGDDQDWADFEEIVWGRTENNDRITDKYITVYKNEKNSTNSRLPYSLQARLAVSANISRHGCDLVFVLKNVSSSDELTTYGCTAKVYGDNFRSGPITLVIQG